MAAKKYSAKYATIIVNAASLRVRPYSYSSSVR